MKINFNVKGQSLCKTDASRVVADSKNYVQFAFSFSEEWMDVEKTAIIKNGGNIYSCLLVENEIPLEAMPVLKSGIATVSVFGGNLITTNEVIMKIAKSGLEIEVIPPAPLDIYSQILSAINKKQDELVSGETIKTVNGESLLGEGDIIGGGAEEEYIEVVLPQSRWNEFFEQTVKGVQITDISKFRVDVVPDASPKDRIAFNQCLLSLWDYNDDSLQLVCITPPMRDLRVKLYGATGKQHLAINNLGEHIVNSFFSDGNAEIGYINFEKSFGFGQFEFFELCVKINNQPHKFADFARYMTLYSASENLVGLGIMVETEQFSFALLDGIKTNKDGSFVKSTGATLVVKLAAGKANTVELVDYIIKSNSYIYILNSGMGNGLDFVGEAERYFISGFVGGIDARSFELFGEATTTDRQSVKDKYIKEYMSDLGRNMSFYPYCTNGGLYDENHLRGVTATCETYQNSSQYVKWDAPYYAVITKFRKAERNNLIPLINNKAQEIYFSETAMVEFVKKVSENFVFSNNSSNIPEECDAKLYFSDGSKIAISYTPFQLSDYWQNYYVNLVLVDENRSENIMNVQKSTSGWSYYLGTGLASINKNGLLRYDNKSLFTPDLSATNLSHWTKDDVNYFYKIFSAQEFWR